MRAAQSLAEETLETLNGLNDFYERHKEVLENASEMREAVLRLLACVFMWYLTCYLYLTSLLEM